MKKRIITIALLTLIVLMAGIIIGWLLSPAGQTWGRDWLRKPDGLTAIATVLAGIGTVGAVIVALFGIRYERRKAQEDRVESQKRFEDEQARAREVLNDERERFEKAQAESQRQFLASQKQTQDALEEGRRQFREAQYAANRPILLPNIWAPNHFNGNPPMSINWNEHEQPSIVIRNEGTGIATNVWGVLMHADPVPALHFLYSSHLKTPMPSGEGRGLDLIKSRTLLNSSDRIVDLDDRTNLCTLGVPKDLALEDNIDPRDRRDRRIARLTLTYHDIFRRKYASIFDYTVIGNWVCVALIPNIEHDLGEIDETKGAESLGERVTFHSRDVLSTIEE